MQTHTSKHTLCPEACFPRPGQSISRGRLGIWQLCNTIQVHPQWRSHQHLTVASLVLQQLLSLQPNTESLPRWPSQLTGWGTRLRSAEIISALCFLPSQTQCAPICRACSHCQPHRRERKEATCLRTLRGENETKLLCVPGKCHYVMKPSCLQTPLH